MTKMILWAQPTSNYGGLRARIRVISGSLKVVTFVDNNLWQPPVERHVSDINKRFSSHLTHKFRSRAYSQGDMKLHTDIS